MDEAALELWIQSLIWEHQLPGAPDRTLLGVGARADATGQKTGEGKGGEEGFCGVHGFCGMTSKEGNWFRLTGGVTAEGGVWCQPGGQYFMEERA